MHYRLSWTRVAPGLSIFESINLYLTVLRFCSTLTIGKVIRNSFLVRILRISRKFAKVRNPKKGCKGSKYENSQKFAKFRKSSQTKIRKSSQKFAKVRRSLQKFRNLKFRNSSQKFANQKVRKCSQSPDVYKELL